MTTAVQRRRGTTTEHSSFTGLEGEISVNTTKDTLVVHDGSTVGGFELARADGSNFVASTVDINGGTIDGTTIGATTPASVAATTGTFSSTVTATGTSVFASLDISGDIDVDGTTNLDVVDIDGAVDMASTLGVTGVATLASLVATTADINAGTIDGTVIGGSTAAAGTFTTGQFNTSLNVDGTVTADGLTMASGSQGVIGVFGTSGLQLIGQTGSDNIIGTMGANEPLVFRTESTERMRIDSSGTLFQGTTSPTLHSSVTGTVFTNAHYLLNRQEALTNHLRLHKMSP
jgi:hypothetical protein